MKIHVGDHYKTYGHKCQNINIKVCINNYLILIYFIKLNSDHIIIKQYDCTHKNVAKQHVPKQYILVSCVPSTTRLYLEQTTYLGTNSVIVVLSSTLHAPVISFSIAIYNYQKWMHVDI